MKTINKILGITAGIITLNVSPTLADDHKTMVATYRSDIQSKLQSPSTSDSCNIWSNLPTLKKRFAVMNTIGQAKLLAPRTKNNLRDVCTNIALVTSELLNSGQSEKWFIKVFKKLWENVETPEEVLEQITEIVKQIEITLRQAKTEGKQKNLNGKNLYKFEINFIKRELLR